MLRMKTLKTLTICGLLVLAVWTLCSERANGWSAGGHRVVADVAYEQLDEAMRTAIVKVLRKHPDFGPRFKQLMPDDVRSASNAVQDRWIFLQASIWPDLISNLPKYKHPTWHYINLTYFPTLADKNALDGQVHPNVSFKLPMTKKTPSLASFNCVQGFKYSLQQLEDAHTLDDQRAIYYCWVLHIGGDIHQPCHSTALYTRARFNEDEGDRGGNKIRTKQASNLHSFWDGLLGKQQTLNQIRSRTTAILADAEITKAATAASMKLDIGDWVVESNKLSREFVYCPEILKAVAAGEADTTKPLQVVDLPDEYREKAGAIAQRRVAEAGFRLAEILKSVAD